MLDAGSGSGTWALAFAQENPGATVIAADITKPNPADSPSNVAFQEVNLERPWPFAEQFDFIHVRMMTIALHDWPTFLTQSRKYLKPGGWLEIDDTKMPYRSGNRNVTAETSANNGGSLESHGS